MKQLQIIWAGMFLSSSMTDSLKNTHKLILALRSRVYAVLLNICINRVEIQDITADFFNAILIVIHIMIKEAYI